MIPVNILIENNTSPEIDATSGRAEDSQKWLSHLSVPVGVLEIGLDCDVGAELLYAQVWQRRLR